MIEYTIIYEPTAENDLLEIVNYYADVGGLPLAISIHERIQNHLGKLSYYPYRAVASTRFPHAREFVIEKLPFKALIVVNEEEKTVYIISIFHTSKKLPN